MFIYMWKGRKIARKFVRYYLRLSPRRRALESRGWRNFSCLWRKQIANDLNSTFMNERASERERAHPPVMNYSWEFFSPPLHAMRRHMETATSVNLFPFSRRKDVNTTLQSRRLKIRDLHSDEVTSRRRRRRPTFSNLREATISSYPLYPSDHNFNPPSTRTVPSDEEESR